MSNIVWSFELCSRCEEVKLTPVLTARDFISSPDYVHASYTDRQKLNVGISRDLLVGGGCPTCAKKFAEAATI